MDQHDTQDDHSMRICAIIQARVGSSRLHRKVLMKLGDKNILEHVIARLKKVGGLSCIAVATTQELGDDPVAEVAQRSSVECFRGSEYDVLSRMIGAAQAFEADVVVRVCADNPFVDPLFVEELMQFSIKQKLDYAGYRLSNGTPAILTGIGLFAEVVTLPALIKTHAAAYDDAHYEHVTYFIYTHPDEFRIGYKAVNVRIENAHLWLTVDTKRDLELTRRIYNSLVQMNKPVTTKEIIKYVAQHPDIGLAMAQQSKMAKSYSFKSIDDGSSNDKRDQSRQ